MKGHRKGLVSGAAAVVIGLAILLAVLGGGSVVRVDTGPLGGGPVHAAVCVPGRTVYIGGDLVQNSTGSPIRVEKFTLVDPQGLKLIGVDLVPIGEVPLIGYGYPYPPHDLRPATWAGRLTVPMTMAPGRTRWNLVYGLERTAKTGTLSYPELLYEYRGAQYLWTSQVAVKVVSGTACLH